VLRYGLPAEYAGVIVKVSSRKDSFHGPMIPIADNLQPDPKTAVKTIKQLAARYNYLGSGKSKDTKAAANDDVVGEWANVMEQEYYDFVLFEIPKVEF
jgi:V-type H+-transporting ATPase subunit C